MEYNHSLVIPHLDENNYAYWKVMMKAFLKSLDERVWLSVETGWERPVTLVDQCSNARKEPTSFNMIVCV